MKHFGPEILLSRVQTISGPINYYDKCEKMPQNIPYWGYPPPYRYSNKRNVKDSLGVWVTVYYGMEYTLCPEAFASGSK